MILLLNQTRLHEILPLYQGEIMNESKKKYWEERGYKTREEWLVHRRKIYREKNQKKCPNCDEFFIGNREFCSNKCNLVSSLDIKSNGCWEWKWGKNPAGYGVTKDYDTKIQKGNRQKNILAHRLSYKIFKGEIEKEKFVCHHCDNRACCNPDHLWIGNHRENAEDALKKNRLFLKGLTFKLKKGGFSPNSKLHLFLSDIKKQIQDGERISVIARKYNVSPQAIYSIKNGATWRNKDDSV